MKIIIKNNSIVKDIGLEDFDEVTKSSKPYVLKFTSNTCHLCKELRPIFEQVADEYKNNFNFGNVNSRAQRKLFSLFKIDGVPEIFIISNGNIHNIKYPEKPDPKSGYSKEYIIEHLENFLNENR